MGNGGDTTVKYKTPKEAQQMLSAIMPMVQGLGQYGTERYFGGAPQLGAPSMSGVLTGQQMYDIPGYNVGSYSTPNYNVGSYRTADPTQAMPTSAWYNSLAPEVKAGLYAPYAEAGQGLMEAMGARGQAGGASTPYTGALGAGLGRIASEAAQNVGLNAWQMTSPALMAGMQAENQRNRDVYQQQSFGNQALFNANLMGNRDVWQQQQLANQAMWNADLARNMQGYNTGQQERVADYNTAMNVWQMPQQLMGMAPQFMPQGIVQPGSNTMGNMFSGGLSGALGGSMIMPGWGTAIGGGLGALTGLFS